MVEQKNKGWQDPTSIYTYSDDEIAENFEDLVYKTSRTNYCGYHRDDTTMFL